jgi:hypothetical protein
MQRHRPHNFPSDVNWRTLKKKLGPGAKVDALVASDDYPAACFTSSEWNKF